MRGGSSKGMFFHADALSADPLLRDRLASGTSKVAILSKSDRPDADGDCLFVRCGCHRRPRHRLVRQLRQPERCRPLRGDPDLSGCHDGIGCERYRSRRETPRDSQDDRPRDYFASGGKRMANDSTDLVARIPSMGKLHHTMTGTAAVIPGTVVRPIVARNGVKPETRIRHPSGALAFGAAMLHDDKWTVTKASMSRSARRLMEGWVRVPAACLDQ
jgi:2-methylaconitate cis-trans-isomerase PrpF